MREEFEDSLKLIIGKYGKALTNADAMVQNLTQKLAAVPEKKTGKVKTCKRNL